MPHPGDDLPTMAPAGPGRTLVWDFLGRVGYREALELQLALRERMRRGEGSEHLLLLEHPHVYTLGRNASRADVLVSAELLEERGIEVVECDRGGQVTYHGPGQLVGYPILDLSPDRRDIRRYVRDLQEVLIGTLATYCIAARLREGQEMVGVWVGEEKIASLGIHLSRWLTTHGFALNVAPELSYFAGIVPCGLGQVRMTSIERQLGERPDLAPDLADVAATVAQQLANRLGRRLVRSAPDIAAAAPVLAAALGLAGRRAAPARGQ